MVDREFLPNFNRTGKNGKLSFEPFEEILKGSVLNNLWVLECDLWTLGPISLI